MAKDALPSAPAQEGEGKKQPERRSSLSRLADFFLKLLLWLVGFILRHWREASMLLIVVVLAIYFQISNQAFLSGQGISVVSQTVYPWAIIAAGEVMLLICGEIDLSVGNVFALAPFIMYFVNQDGLPMWVGIICALLVSGVVGLLNGAVTVLLKIPSFITTLGTLFLLEGIALIISGGFPITVPPAGALGLIFGHSFQLHLNLHLFGLNVQTPSYNLAAGVVWAIAIAIVMQIVLSFTRWGLHTVATGGNILGASETGINVNRVKIGNFIMCSMFGGLAGMLEGFRIGSLDPTNGGANLMFMAVAGSVIGGTSLMGGSGTIIGAFLGTLVLAILQEGFTLLGVSAFTFDVILGIAILAAMILNVRIQLLREAGRQ
jgi:simple sugar transport system permease protein